MRALKRGFECLEETFIVLLLVAMLLISFSQVVARYVFNSGWGAALELTTVCFAWMMVLGMSYCVRTGGHIGVDALIKLLPKPWYRAASIFVALLCAFWAILLFDSDWFTTLLGMRDRGGAWMYVAKMYSIGLELEEIPLPRWIAYSVLPFGLLLFAYRCFEAVWQIASGARNAMIVAHEEEHGQSLRDNPHNPH